MNIHAAQTLPIRDLLRAFEASPPEIVFNWNDVETGAEGWAVINSLKGGAAGGGTRMRKGLDRDEVVSLAKTMEIKFSVSGPRIGGAKSGINFDPSDPRRTEVLRRWFKAVSPILKTYYGTAGDLNVDEATDVIPLTEENGLWHPQEGVVRGHYQADAGGRIRTVHRLRSGGSQIVEDPGLTPDAHCGYSVSDLVTGWGVAEAVRHYFALYGGELAGKRVIVQGWGNVGSSAAFYLARQGARIVGIVDQDGGLINREGYTFEAVRNLYLSKQGNRLVSQELLPAGEVDKEIWDVGAEIFLPCAASRLVEKWHVDRLLANGLEVISCGANVPFNDPEIFYGPIYEYADGNVGVIPDFVANCGMARTFAYLMSEAEDTSPEAIFQDVSQTIHAALLRCRSTRPGRLNIAETAYRNALGQ